jgi:DNA invertase Pin-like site-specific DNA recombinase
MLNDRPVPKKLVAYYRLSKPKRGKNKSETIRDAYGMTDQRRDVASIRDRFDAQIIGEFAEIETGTNKKAHRPELEKAILMARFHKATLVIGRQDRLGRNTHFITGLMEKGIHFMCADAPDQTEMAIEVRASFDAEEARRISARTKAALAIVKENGKKLGSARPGHWKGREHLRGFKQATIASVLAKRRRVHENYDQVIHLITEWQSKGMPLTVIAENLNEMGHSTLACMPFTQPAVSSVLKLYGKKLIKHFVTGTCTECNRGFRVSWEQQQHPEQPLVCYRCIKKKSRRASA